MTNILEASGVIENTEEIKEEVEEKKEEETTTEIVVDEKELEEIQEKTSEEIEKKVEEHIEGVKEEIEKKVEEQLEEDIDEVVKDKTSVDLMPILKEYAKKVANLEVESSSATKKIELLTAKNIELTQENLELKSSSVQILPEHKFFIKSLYNYEKNKDEASKNKFLSYFAEYAEENLGVRANQVMSVFEWKVIKAPEEKIAANEFNEGVKKAPEYKYTWAVIRKPNFVV